MTRTAFLDRDGTINREVDYLDSPDRLELLPGAREALHLLRDAGFRIVVLTNQSGIARGRYGERDLARIHERLHEGLDRLPLAYLHCPHHPSPGSGADPGYVRECTCRKPKGGLLREAASMLGAFGVQPDGGVVIGDSARDVLMADRFDMTRILVRSGKPIDAQRATLRERGVTVDHEAADLKAAVTWLLGQRRRAECERG